MYKRQDQDVLTTETVAVGFKKAVETAYKAVMKPKEGTILTVAKVTAEKAVYLSLIHIYSVEKQLHISTKNQELIELLELEKSLVYFSTSLRSNELVLEKMLKIDKIKQLSLIHISTESLFLSMIRRYCKYKDAFR